MRSFTTCLLLTLFISGCSGGDDKPSAIATVEGFCLKWADRACTDTAIEACQSDRESCLDGQAAFCESIVPTGKYSREGAKQCLTAVADAYADAVLDAEEYETVRELGPPCDLILSGSAGPGETCEADDDCSREAGLSCVIRAGEPSGTCQEAEIVGGGFACDGPAQVCDVGFYCNGENCIAEQGQGDPCSAELPCAPNFKCELPSGEPPGPADTDAVCVERLDDGAVDCEEDNDCKGGFCVVGTAENVCSDRQQLTVGGPICQNLR